MYSGTEKMKLIPIPAKSSNGVYGNQGVLNFFSSVRKIPPIRSIAEKKKTNYVSMGVAVEPEPAMFQKSNVFAKDLL